MKILCSMPGRAGDIAWALPTVRAISEHFGVPVDLQIAGEFAPMLDLLLQQPYLAGVIPDSRWGLSEQDSWKAPELPQKYDRVIHLGYRGWPKLPLPNEVYDHCRSNEVNLPLGPLGLDRPWITVAEPFDMGRVVCGWSDCYFELKVGLHALMEGQSGWVPAILSAPGSRWLTERTQATSVHEMPWDQAAEAIAGADVFLGDCSALHVLACALGKPVVCYEPMEARWNPIFYPYGQDGPQVTLVRGLDGKPTTDARHTAETLERVLGRVK